MATKMLARDVSDLPVYREDIYAETALRSPFRHYQAIRDLGPLVRIGDTDLLAMARFDDVQAALRSPDVLISGKGVGFNHLINGPFPEPSVLNSDGDRHRAMRAQIIRPLMPAALKQHRERLKGMIVERVQECVDAGWIEGIDTLARHLPLAAISHLVGFPEYARQKMLNWATAQFDLMQPYKPALEEVVATLNESREFLATVKPSELRPDGWAAALLAKIGEGRLTEGQARSAMSGYALPSLDTTINSKGCLLFLLGTHLDQWQLLKDEPALIPSAVLESMRMMSTVRWFSRFAASDYVHNDVYVPEGSRVMVMYGAANRDERHYADAERFDVRRNPTDQLGWGTGPHMCAGMHLARLEMEVLVEALVENVDTLEIGEGRMGTNAGLFGFETLPVRLTRN